MAKELYSGPITFDASAQTVAIEGNYSHDKLLLITNVTDGVSIYNFASNAKGANAISYDSDTELTTITLNYDTTSMSDDDNLQIFTENYNQMIHFSDDMIDGVGKLRVSNPENLIDTDFEYGLQPTKWETLEMSNFVPSFYVGEGDLPLEIVTSITATNGSSNVVVNCNEAHGLSVGTPIEVQGLSSRTAEGKFLIKFSDTNSFTYVANAPQSVTGEIGSIYSTVTPGTFYTGSEIAFDPATGLASDGAAQSDITITTEDPHGFEASSNFYLVNTVGAKTFELTETSTDTAPDTREYVDDINTISTSFTPTLSGTETKQIRAKHHHKFDGSSVNTSNNTITWPDHSMKNNDCVLYMKPAGDARIGGLNSFDVYYVRVIDNNTLQLTSSYNGTAISLTSTGTSLYGRHSLNMVYEVIYATLGRRNYLSTIQTRAYRNGLSGGANSGWDLNQTFNGSPGLGSGTVQKVLSVAKQNTSIYYYTHNRNSVPHFGQYKSSNFTMVDNNTNPKNYNFVEDYTRFNYNFGSNHDGTSSYRSNSNGGYFLYNTYYSGRSYAWNFTHGMHFVMPVVLDEEADTLYYPNHGIFSGDPLSITTNSGTNIFQSTSTTAFNNNNSPTALPDDTYTAERVTPDRFRVSGKRIQYATGNYTMAITKVNETKNSFYVPNHGLTNQSQVLLTTGTGGVLPTANTGQVLPIYTSNPSDTTLPQAYSVLENIVDNYFINQSIDVQDFVSAGNSESTRVINSGVSSGSSPISSYDLGYSGSVLGGGWGTVNIPGSNLYLSGLSEETPRNLLAGTTATGTNRQWSIAATNWAENASMSKYMYVYGVNRDTSTEYWYEYFRDGFVLTSGGANRALLNSINQSRTVTGTGNVYKFAYSAISRTLAGAPNMHHLRLKFCNTSDWSNYNTNTYAAYTTLTNPLQTYYNNGTNSSSYYQRDDMVMGLTFFTDNIENWGTAADYATLVNHIIDQFDANYVYPSLTNATVYNVNAVNNNRFSLKSVSSGIEVDLTSNGTSPFSFKTQGVLGVIDGTYTSSSVTDDTIVISTNNKVEGATVTVDSTTITAGNALVVANQGTHTFLNGTAVTYNDGGGTSIGGLTSGDTYYVRVIDDQYFHLSGSEEDAINGENIISMTAGSGADHTFVTSSLAGTVEAVGTVTTVEDDTIIRGSNSLFKRYFKAGDTIFIKNDNYTPGAVKAFTVTAIADDTTLTVATAPNFSTTNTKYFVGSKVYARPDGYAVHRPFDGGVEIAAGTAPYSHICRQTRKYFRYQSGKGIQTSLAINFNPPVTLETLSLGTGFTPDNETYTVSNDGNTAWDISEVGPGTNPDLTLYRGATYTFNLSASGHPFYFTTDDGTDYVSGNYVDEYTTGVTGSRTESGTVTFVVPAGAPDTLYYACGNHEDMIGTVAIMDFPSEQAIATTKYPHRLTNAQDLRIKGASDGVFNGTRTITAIVDDFTFRYSLGGTASTSTPNGIIKYNLAGYTGASTRAGMFDFQNGFFYEFDGNNLNCVRRSSTTQLSGTVACVNNSGKITGTSTQFSGQLALNDRVVLRGQSYKVVKINSNTEMFVQPAFRGISTDGVIVTKTEDLKVAQSDWNIDKCDGTGPTGFILDIDKIQMAYMDYSWYGAGKIRFGFKERTGQIRYVHQFVHNNRLDEAYMRSGNLPAKYEVENDDNPTYAPTLFHWGTSVIMDGTFDDDKAYLFTAPSNSLSFTNGESSDIVTTGASTLYYQYNYSQRRFDWYTRIPFNSADAASFYAGLELYTADGSLNGEKVSFTGYTSGQFYVYIYIQTSRNAPATYPTTSSGETVSLGVPAGGGGGSGNEVVNLGTDTIPLVSLRLAPSVDSNLTGDLGERDIINRMQLKLNEVGLILTHDCEVKLILNGDLSNVNWENVQNPSLSQLIKHESGDIISGGTEVFSFRASGGTTDNAGARLSNTSNFSLGDIIDLGNAILGGNGTFPNGPDVLTVAVQVVDTGGIGADNPFKTSARVTWSESQA